MVERGEALRKLASAGKSLPKFSKWRAFFEGWQLAFSPLGGRGRAISGPGGSDSWVPLETRVLVSGQGPKAFL